MRRLFDGELPEKQNVLFEVIRRRIGGERRNSESDLRALSGECVLNPPGGGLNGLHL